MFKSGDKVRNINPKSRYYAEICDKIGTFQRMLPWTATGESCDVEYPGISGPYEYPYLAQRVSDLEIIKEEQSA